LSKPLHVQVAEALGHSVADINTFYGWMRVPPDNWNGTDPIPGDIPHYDTDWSATGPLIEKYSISVAPQSRSHLDVPPSWQTDHKGESVYFQISPSPLEAVCNLLLALHKAGKLP